MSKIKNELGNVYGNWTVLSFADSQGSRGARWNCKCSCGYIKPVYGAQLRSGESTSCGKCGINKKVMPQDAALRKAYSRVKDIHVRERGFSLDEFLTLEEYSKVVFNKCTYCNIEPSCIRTAYSIRKHNPVHNSVKLNGIDRIDSTKGYTKRNSVACCPQCNTMKSDLTILEFYDQIERIYKHAVSSNL